MAVTQADCSRLTLFLESMTRSTDWMGSFSRELENPINRKWRPFLPPSPTFALVSRTGASVGAKLALHSNSMTMPASLVPEGKMAVSWRRRREPESGSRVARFC